MNPVTPKTGFAVPTAVLPVGYARTNGQGEVCDLAGFMRRVAADMATNGAAGVDDPRVHLTVAAAGFIEALRVFDAGVAQAVEALCFGDEDGVRELAYVEDLSDEPTLAWHPADIKAALQKRGVSQTSLAEAAGVTVATVGSVLHGHGRSARVAQLIAEAAGTSVDAIWPGVYGEITSSRTGYDAESSDTGVKAQIERMQTAYGFSGHGSQRKLARMLGEKPTTVASWIVRGKIPLRAFQHVSKATGRSLDWLIGQGGQDPATIEDEGLPPITFVRLKAAYEVDSIDRLAELMNVPLSTAKGWSRRDSVPLPVVVRAAKETGVSTDWLLGLTDTPIGAQA